MEDKNRKSFSDPSDVMLLLAREAENVVIDAGKSARREAEEETGKLLTQYEQRAKQIVLKIREESRSRAEEMAARFRDALILKIEEAATAAMYESISGVGSGTGEIVSRLQEIVKKETRQALAEGLVAGERKLDFNRAFQPEHNCEAETDTVKPDEIKPAAENVTAAFGAAAEFEKWLMQ